ncbi:MAG: hypothetical protein U0795_12205 [Pirellulales bacterium]
MDRLQSNVDQADSPDENRAPPIQRGLQPPRFSVRSLLWVLAIFSILMAATRSLDPRGQFVLWMATLSVLAHLASTSIGSRLRATSDHANRLERTQPDRADVPPSIVPKTHHYAPRTTLAQHHPLPRTIFWGAAVGSVIGALWGGVNLAAINWAQATVASVAMGAIASGLLGGFLGFAIASLGTVFRGAWRDATRHDRHTR